MKLKERRLDCVIGLEMIEMLGIDIGDDGIVAGQLQEGAVGFVRLDHHPVSLAHTGIGAIGVDDAAIDHRRIEIPAFQQGGDDGGGGGLAVGAGDGDRGLEPHQLREHLGAAHYGQTQFTRGGEFGIVAPDRGGDDDDFRVPERFPAAWPVKVEMPFFASRATLALPDDASEPCTV